ncbi:hypothetical protein V493_02624 [Pseudogymnoascus sp. VKM F-4281 (FW-2241)]|nr:hypothetical protein V493_02624 [Pseudogymnoascus sp. VKM F-4281 (FW-2241)]
MITKRPQMTLAIKMRRLLRSSPRTLSPSHPPLGLRSRLLLRSAPLGAVVAPTATPVETRWGPAEGRAAAA